METTKSKKWSWDLAYWATEKDILEAIRHGRMRKVHKDYYTAELLGKLVARIETLEGCIDEMVAEKK